ncbi:hypothetical protein AB0368_29030 [Actinoplanes sp. NPDC051475]
MAVAILALRDDSSAVRRGVVRTLILPAVDASTTRVGASGSGTAG